VYALTRLAGGVFAAWLLLAAELVVFAVVSRGELASIWELEFGALWLAPTALAAGGVIGIWGGVLAALLEHAERRWARILGACGVLLFGSAVAWGVGGGRHLATLSTRGGFALAVGVVGAAVAFVCAPWLARALRRAPAAFVAAVLALVCMLELANRFVLVRLYPAFHIGLAVACLALVALVPVCLARLSARGAPSMRSAAIKAFVAGFVIVASAVAARPAATQLAYFDNFRLLMIESAPILGRGIELTGWLAPPAPIAPADDCAPGDVQCEGAPIGGERTLDLRGRDLLLVTIDAVRADHTSVYGYARKTTPALEELARGGAVFEYAYCATPHTSYSVTSLMTGKYMRPLLLQGAGADSDTWAGLLRTYGYRTAAFYPPAVFFIDPRNFEGFKGRHLDFEYQKFEFLEGPPRVEQVRAYLNSQPLDRNLFVWVHLFGPHEPYEAHPEHPFGARDVDRYDAEIAAADATLGSLVKLFRKRRANTAVIVSSDHGEEFGEHGGRYHGTTVYEEQVRVPLVVSIPGVNLTPRIPEPVQSIDLLPTVLSALEIPRPPRVRGRDLGPLLTGKAAPGSGFAHAETEDHALLAEGPHRLICDRRLGACSLYDLRSDPRQTTDISHREPARFEELRRRLRELGASHGRYEMRGLRAEGKGWPAPILRGVAGDTDAAEEIAALLDDADRQIRRKAAELLFNLKRKETAPALRLAVSRDEDAEVRSWAALALTRLGEGAPLTFELAESPDVRWRRLASLALAESGDARGGEVLLAWWKDAEARDFARSRELVAAIAKIRFEDAVWPLVQSLDDVRLRPYIATALAELGQEEARGPLARALAGERYQSARGALAAALVKLGAEEELAPPLARFLGVPDPIEGGLGYALAAGVLDSVGGPSKRDLAKLRKEASVGVAVTLTIPRGGNGQGVRAVVRARTRGAEPGEVLVGPRLNAVGQPSPREERSGARRVPQIDPERATRIAVPKSQDWVEAVELTPPAAGYRAGQRIEVVVFADSRVELDAAALVPLADELPPPAPEPWKPEEAPKQP
jgi:arylsulfatase A-like enzyme